MPQKTKKQKIQSKQRRISLKKQDNANHNNDLRDTRFESSHNPIASPMLFSFKRHSLNHHMNHNQDALFPAEREIAKTVIISIAAIIAVVLVSFAL